MPGIRPAAGSYSLSRYLNVRSAYFPSFASDGRRIAFLTDTTGLPQAWQVEVSAKVDEVLWPDQLTFGDDRVLGVWCSPAPGDSRLIYSRDEGGNEQAQLFLLPMDGGAEEALTAGHDGAMHIFGEWSADGSQFIFAANRRDKGLFDLYLQPVGSEARMIWQNDKPGFLYKMSFSPDGKRVITTRMPSSFRHDLFEVEIASGAVRQVSPSTRSARFHAASYATDGRSLFVNTDIGSDFLQIARLDLDTLAPETVLSHEWDVEFMTLSPDGRYLAYALNVDGASELHLLDLSSGATRACPEVDASPGVVAMMDWRLRFSPGSRRLAFSFTSATRTSDIFVWDLETNEVRAVTRSSHAGLPTDSFIAPELIHYPTFDSDRGGGVPQIPAWFYKPRETQGEPLPVVIIAHGGPEGQARPNLLTGNQYLLHQGYAVLIPNVRGSTGYGKAYSHLDDVEKRMDSVADLAHAAHWLRNQPDIDGDRIAVAGGSYGGFMVLSALTTYSDLWAAGVDMFGISNFVTFLENTSEYRREFREAEYGSLDHDRKFLDSISPLNHLYKIAAPLMVIHGANDPRVPLSEAEQLVQALKAQDTPVEFLVFDDEGHGLAKLKNKLVAYPAMVEFLDRYLTG